jgi:hypothetical protein
VHVVPFQTPSHVTPFDLASSHRAAALEEGGETVRERLKAARPDSAVPSDVSMPPVDAPTVSIQIWVPLLSFERDRKSGQ